MKSKTFTRLLAGAAFALAMTGAAWAKVDINHATEAQLQALHGVGPAKAHAIVVERQAHGRFASLDDISKRVPGIGAATVQGFAADVSFAPVAASPAKTATAAPAAHPVATAPAAAVHPATPAVAATATKTGAATTHAAVTTTATTTKTGATTSHAATSTTPATGAAMTPKPPASTTKKAPAKPTGH